MKEKQKEILTQRENDMKEGCNLRNLIDFTDNEEEEKNKIQESLNTRQKEYEVEQIIDVRQCSKKGLIQYQVKWVGYTEMTWEPEGNLQGVQDLIKNFYEKQSKNNQIESQALSIDINHQVQSQSSQNDLVQRNQEQHQEIDNKEMHQKGSLIESILKEANQIDLQNEQKPYYETTQKKITNKNGIILFDDKKEIKSNENQKIIKKKLSKNQLIQENCRMMKTYKYFPDAIIGDKIKKIQLVTDYQVDNNNNQCKQQMEEDIEFEADRSNLHFKVFYIKNNEGKPQDTYSIESYNKLLKSRIGQRAIIEYFENSQSQCLKKLFINDGSATIKPVTLIR